MDSHQDYTYQPLNDGGSSLSGSLSDSWNSDDMLNRASDDEAGCIYKDELINLDKKVKNRKQSKKNKIYSVIKFKSMVSLLATKGKSSMKKINLKINNNSKVNT